jgi:hypothetical protein
MNFYRYICAALLVSALSFPLYAQDAETDSVGEAPPAGEISPPQDEGRTGNDAEYEDEEPINSGTPIQSGWLGEKYSVYARGDKIFAITLGTLFPLVFTDTNYSKLPNKLSPVGGTGSLNFFYFLTPHIFVGGELQGSFSQTIGENFLFLVPVTIHAGYQFIVSRFEFPLSLGIGGATHSYRGRDLYNFFAKGEVSAFFRLNSDWSFGLNAAFLWAPEVGTQDPDTKRKTPEHDAYGHFFEVTASARYHF